MPYRFATWLSWGGRRDVVFLTPIAQTWLAPWARPVYLWMDVIVVKRDSSLLLLYYNEYNSGHDDEEVYNPDQYVKIKAFKIYSKMSSYLHKSI